MKKLFLRLQTMWELRPEFRQHATIAAVVLLCLGYWTIKGLSGGSQSAEVDSPEKPEAIDTYIPLGFVLVPIEITNKSAVEAVLGDRAVVDLYRQSEKGTTEKVASSVKLVRAPLNPSQFAVLVPEDESERLVQGASEYTVVIQNRKASRSRFQRQSAPQARRTIIHEEI